jgi:hypothetical protein
VGSSEYDLGAGGAHRISSAVRPSRHPGHRADSDKLDVTLPNEVAQLGVCHRFGVSIDQEHLVAGRSQRL